MSRILVEQYGGDVPLNREALQALPGVGRKTASVVLNELRVEPAVVEDLRQQWLESVSTKVLVVSERDRAELERLLGGEIRSSGQLVARVRERAAANDATSEGAR